MNGRAVLLFAGFLLGLVMASAFPSAAARAGALETLVMPGPVIAGHAKVETECRRCHEPFSKVEQKTLCLACHKEVGQDIAAGRGFHGRAPGIAASECKRCHTEHEGRDADIVGLDRETFDHRLTDFPLDAAHRGVACQGCHSPDRAFRAAPSECVACHRDDDPHRGRLGAACADCHTGATWREARFDHDKATRFPLAGKHAKVACAACHSEARYKGTPTKCAACHRLNDVHGGRFGARCETCHAPAGWRGIVFDHARDTRFPLAGAHKAAPCAACHGERIGGPEKPPTRCVACHEKDDEHKGRNGPKCESCHIAASWSRTTFDHARDARFALKGRHAALACAACHEGPVFEVKLGRTCAACHEADDVHKGGLGADCAACHGETDWKRVAFDHARDTRFLLVGAHESAVCRACHTPAKAPNGKRARLATDCFACHEADDVHDGKLGRDCARCHNARGWAGEVFFDHDLTRFPLIGLHATVPCAECHLAQTFKETPLDCAACHAEADVHKQTLGADCALCHNPNGWDLWRFDHDTQTDFRLTGAHDGLECRACHREPVTGEISLARNCNACHQADDVHRGRFGARCERCHTTRSFKEIRLDQ